MKGAREKSANVFFFASKWRANGPYPKLLGSGPGLGPPTPLHRPADLVRPMDPAQRMGPAQLAHLAQRMDRP